MSYAAIMLLALALDALIGWPAWLFARIGHPVTWLGALIDLLDSHLNRIQRSEKARRARGVFTALIVTALAAAAGALVVGLLPEGALGVVIGGVLAWPLVAVRSLHEHVAAVARPLQAGDLEAARGAVAHIVGRDPAQLDEAAVARASLESLAENASDGVVAPLLWGALLGLPGIAAYKAINTLDSMIGHRTPRHAAFGWASARIDDVVNLLPARLTALLFVLVSPKPRASYACMQRDAGHHRSPNAGWPEAAMAGALTVRLSGPRRYGGTVTEEPWVNSSAPNPTASDVLRGLALFRRSTMLLAALLALLAFV